jgi:hypothetical protein
MKKAIFIIICSSFVLTSFSEPERKFQIWNKTEVLFHPWEKMTIDVAEKIHFSPEHGAADVKYGELFLSHEPLKWFEYGAGFRATYKNTYPGWLSEYRPMILANFKKSHKEFNFKYSNRLEYRIFEIDVNHFRYRQEFLVEFPALTNWGMRFYSSEEAFIKLNGAGLHLARFYEGLSVIQKEHFKLKLYYALEKLKLIENWGTTDIAGLNLSFIL